MDADERYKVLAQLIDNWLSRASGWFGTEKVWAQFNVRTQEGKGNVWKILNERVDQDILKRQGMLYKRVDADAEEVEWWEADAKPLDIRWPFSLQKYCQTYPHSLVTVAGDWGAGKTAFLYNVIFQNMDAFKSTLFNSEMSKENIKKRILNYDNHIPIPPAFRVFNRTGDFADVIDPDGLNVIDYMRIKTDQFFAVADDLREVLDKLRDGVVIVGLQKPRGRDIPYGGDPAMWDISMGLSITKDRLKITKIRTPVDGLLTQEIEFSFKLGKGINFYDISTTLG